MTQQVPFQLEDGTRPSVCFDKTVDEIDFELAMLKQADSQLMGELNEHEKTGKAAEDKQYTLYRNDVMGRHYKLREEQAQLEQERAVILQRRKEAAVRAGRLAALPKFTPDPTEDQELLMGLETQRQLVLLYKNAMIASASKLDDLLREGKKRGIIDKQMLQEMEEWR